jgi:hypothetical protein
MGGKANKRTSRLPVPFTLVGSFRPEGSLVFIDGQVHPFHRQFGLSHLNVTARIVLGRLTCGWLKVCCILRPGKYKNTGYPGHIHVGGHFVQSTRTKNKNPRGTGHALMDISGAPTQLVDCLLLFKDWWACILLLAERPEGKGTYIRKGFAYNFT